MREFSRDNRSRGNGGDRGDRQMHDAICANCGKHCQVPFKPSGEKPVYCDDCFSEFSGNDNRSYGRNDRDDSYGERRSDRRRREFGEPSGVSHSSGNSEQVKELMTLLDKKLDKVIDLLSTISEKKTLRVGLKEKKVTAKEE